MKVKEILITLGMIILVPIVSVVCIYWLNPLICPETYTKLHENAVNMKQIIANNHEPGRDAAYKNALWLQSLDFSIESIKEELEELGYTDSEIKYAIKKIGE